MKNRIMGLNPILIMAFFFAACNTTAQDTMQESENTRMESPTEKATMPHETPMPEAMAEPTEETMMESPSWFGVSFTDIRNGGMFTINDFKGKVILVETMAVWCPTCYRQQEEIKALHELLGMREDFISVSLDIDPNENETILGGYLQQNSQFDWYYAITGPDVAREIGNTYGDQFLNPPSAPVLVIDRHGTVHPLPFGLKSAEELRQLIQPFLDESI